MCRKATSSLRKVRCPLVSKGWAWLRTNQICGSEYRSLEDGIQMQEAPEGWHSPGGTEWQGSPPRGRGSLGRGVACPSWKQAAEGLKRPQGAGTSSSIPGGAAGRAASPPWEHPSGLVYQQEPSSPASLHKLSTTAGVPCSSPCPKWDSARSSPRTHHSGCHAGAHGSWRGEAAPTEEGELSYGCPQDPPFGRSSPTEPPSARWEPGGLGPLSRGRGSKRSALCPSQAHGPLLSQLGVSRKSF